MIKINLLPVREKVKEENIRRQISIGVLLIVLAIIIMGYFWFQKYQEVQDLRENKAALEKTLARLKKEVGDLSKIKKERDALKNRKAAIADLNKNRLVLVQVLDQITAIKPESLYFTKLEQKNSGDPWENFTLTLQGIAVDNAVIAKFMKDLQKIKVLRDVDLDYTKTKSKSRKVGEGFKEFKMNIQVVIAPEPTETKEKGKKKKKG